MSFSGLLTRLEVILGHNHLEKAIEEERAQAARGRPASEGQACRVCGCTNNHACRGGCWWVEEDLCSTCADQLDERLTARQKNGAAVLLYPNRTYTHEEQQHFMTRYRVAIEKLALYEEAEEAGQ